MQNFNKTIVALFIALLGCFGFYAGTHQQPVSVNKLGDGSNINNIYTIPTNSTATVGSSTLIVATSTSRNYFIVVNDSANTVYISIGAPAVVGRGIRLNANGGSYEMKQDQVFTASVFGASAASSSVTFIESK